MGIASANMAIAWSTERALLWRRPQTELMACTTMHRRRKGGARELKPPLRMISHRNYLSWSGAENRDKDRDTLIEQSL